MEPEFKSKLVLEVLRGERMLDENASDNEVRYRDINCFHPKYFKELEQMPLLYLIGKKEYNNPPGIVNEWNRAEAVLFKSAGIAIYGYGVPVTDVEAVELMKSAISINRMKDIAPFTIKNLSENEEE